MLVGGGPAPGINGVIAAATIEAIASGLSVVGLRQGYAHIARGDLSQVMPLTVDDVTRAHFEGGSILGTSRTNPAKDAQTLRTVVDSLQKLGITHLVTIGGDDTSFGAAKISQEAGGRIAVAAVPKTIDNDLPLPDGIPTFGFETARAVGTRIVQTLLEDARSTDHWYLVVSMGRNSGSLALGIARSAGATLALIPEEFPRGDVSLETIVTTVVGSIVKRKAHGYGYGVVVLAEGLIDRLSPADRDAMAASLPKDAYGHIRLTDLPFGDDLRDSVRKRLDEIGVTATVVAKDLGYELRCAPPVPFDLEYTRTLGYGAVRYLLEGGSGALITFNGERIVPLQLAQLLDPKTGRIRVRSVDAGGEGYRIARRFMSRLESEDFQGDRLRALAAHTKLEPEAFCAAFDAAV
ncbi:MAG TPA: diphosphate--fructose-6-phosphate 1-phosphotransferase [Candidatus Acidoferrales bacterium]|nr:diphosphate--fructose-6-phosphate 1-phosphotransferase [Candidatus Acidoferrales bacterium]